MTRNNAGGGRRRYAAVLGAVLGATALFGGMGASGLHEDAMAAVAGLELGPMSATNPGAGTETNDVEIGVEFDLNQGSALAGRTIDVTVNAVGAADICSVTETNPLVTEVIGPTGNGVNSVAVSLTGNAITFTTLTATYDYDGKCDPEEDYNLDVASQDFEIVARFEDQVGTPDKTAESGTYSWFDVLSAGTAWIEHWDLDVGHEHESLNTNGLLGVQFHDPDDATGSRHRACIRGTASITFAESANVRWTIANSFGEANTALPATGVPGPGNPAEACVSWSSSETGAQTISATWIPSGDVIYHNGVNVTPAQPLIKEWNTIDSTRIVSVVGDVWITSGDFDNWGTTKATGDTCLRNPGSTDPCHEETNVDELATVPPGGPTSVNGVLITSGPAAGFVLAAPTSFMEFAIGSHLNGAGQNPPDYDGPIDGVETKFTISGDCGSVLIERPFAVGSFVSMPAKVSGNSVSVISSDKGVGFSVYPTSSGGAPSGPADQNLDCRPGDRTVVEIESEEDVQLRSDLAMELRPNYDIMLDPRTADSCLSDTQCTAKQGDTTTTSGFGQDDVEGPFSLLDGPLNDDGTAPSVLGGFRDTWLQDGVINETDAPMPPALVTFDRTGSGFLKGADKFGIYDANPFYVTNIPAEPWIPRFTADNQGYQWDSWANDGLYTFWEDWVGASDAGKALVYSDNHGEAMVYVNGDDSGLAGAGTLTFADCSDQASLDAQNIVSLSREYCETDDEVGATTLTALADYPDKRKHSPPVRSNEVDITWLWAGYKVVDVYDGENDQFKYVVIHVTDRDGYCTGSELGRSTTPSMHGVFGEDIDFTLDVIGGGRIVGVSDNSDGSAGTLGILGQDAQTTLADADTVLAGTGVEPLSVDECAAWVKISNSLLGVTDVLVTADDPEGMPVFDRIVDFQTQVDYTLYFRWTLITWPGEDGIEVGDALNNALGDISTEVTAIYGWDAVAQVWLAYFPDGVGVPGANDLAVLETRVAYWVAIGGPGNVSWEIAINVD